MNAPRTGAFGLGQYRAHRIAPGRSGIGRLEGWVEEVEGEWRISVGPCWLPWSLPRSKGLARLLARRVPKGKRRYLRMACSWVEILTPEGPKGVFRWRVEVAKGPTSHPIPLGRGRGLPRPRSVSGEKQPSKSRKQLKSKRRSSKSAKPAAKEKLEAAKVPGKRARRRSTEKRGPGSKKSSAHFEEN